MGLIKTNKTNITFTEGSLWDKIIKFAIPLVAISILQQLFTTADMAIVGHCNGKQALAAVGSTAVITGFIIELFTGLSVGVNVVTAKFIGSGNLKQVGKTVSSSIILAMITGIILTSVGLTLSKLILNLMDVPQDILPQATVYLRIYIGGIPFLVIYNFCAAMLRSRGNTKLPFYVLLISGVINVILNMFFVLILKMGVAGVAIATVISQAISALCLVLHLIFKDDLLKLDLKNLHIDKEILLSFIKIGLPASFLGSVFSISNLCIQSAINSLGTDVVSASAAAANVEIYVQFFGNAFAQTATTFISQNYGAKNYPRCDRIAKTTLMQCVFVTLILSITVYLNSSLFLRLFTNDSTVIAIAVTRMKYTLLFKFIQCVMDIMVGCLQGYGYTFVPALISVFGVCGIRLMWIAFVFPHFHTLEGLMIIYPITQAIASVSHTLCYLIFRKNNFKTVSE